VNVFVVVSQTGGLPALADVAAFPSIEKKVNGGLLYV
jgi:hypothetical protein